MKSITIMAAKQKSYDCPKGSSSIAADSYIILQDNITYCPKGAGMQVKKSIRIPVHYDTTNTKIGILDRLTSRLTYCIRLISDLIDEDTKLDRTTFRKQVKNSDIEVRTGISYGFRDQCIDKVIWVWRSYKKLHKDWEKKLKRAVDRVESARDDKEKDKAEKSLEKLLKREPSKPSFEDKTPCRIDYRTGKVEVGKGKFSPLWIHVSTLEKNNTINIPLNPSQYHLNQLKDAEIDDFEIVKRNKKYYVHISITKVVENKSISSIGGIDQGLNRSLAVVLLDASNPREELILDATKRDLLDKYDEIISSLQEAEKWDKLRELRNKRANVATYHDWILANKTADLTEGSLIAIGNAPFRQTQFRGNDMPKLRKRIGKWSYSRQRKYIALKRAERGYSTKLREERYTSRQCRFCGSILTTRKYGDGHSYLMCHCCNSKEDADITGAYNIAFRCQDDWLKVQMNMVGGKPHASA